MNDKYNELEKQLRNRFSKALRDYKTDNVVDILIDILKEDYIILARVPLSCRDCVNYYYRSGYPSDWCVRRQKYIHDCKIAYNCRDYLGAEEEARKSIARLHSDLTDEWIIDTLKG